MKYAHRGITSFVQINISFCNSAKNHYDGFLVSNEEQQQAYQNPNEETVVDVQDNHAKERNKPQAGIHAGYLPHAEKVKHLKEHSLQRHRDN